MVLTQLQKDVTFGTLLGSGNLETNTNGNTWKYQAVHKTAHEAYIFHKYEILKSHCTSPPKIYNFSDPKTEKICPRYGFQTVIDDDFIYYGKLFYKQQSDNSWKKKVPWNVGSLLTPRAMAYWYMDDGALKWKGRSNAVRLCTDSFSSNDVRLLKTSLEKKFLLKVSIQKKDNIERLCISESSYPILRDLILPYLLPSIHYKFPDGNRGIYQDQDISNDIINHLDHPKDEKYTFPDL